MTDMYLDSNLFDRKLVLDLLKKRLLGLKEGYRQNIALLGSRYLGKTSIVQKFLANLDDPETIVIYLDCEHKDFQYLFWKYAGGILYHYAKVQNLPLHDDINLLMESHRKSIPHTVKAISKIQLDINQGRLSEAFHALINLPDIFSAETKKFCLVILDEFHYLEDLGVREAFQQLGKIIMTQRKCLYVLTSSACEKSRQILSEDLSLLFGNFEIVPVEPFDLKTSQEFMQYLLGNIHIGSSVQNFLIDFTGGHPLYLKLIVRELKHLCTIHQQSEIFSPLVVQALENILFDPWGALSRQFESMAEHICEGKGNGIASALLVNLASGRQRIQDLGRAVKVKQNILSQRLNNLLHEEIIAKNGQFFYLKDRLLKYWLKYVYQKRLKAIEFSMVKEQQAFVEEINRTIDDFKIHSQKDLSTRVVELLTCFDSEAVNVKGRKYKLPTFHKIVPLTLKTAGEYPVQIMKASTAEGPWFIILKRDQVSENEVNTFLEEAKVSRIKPLRCIVISLVDLEQNARLKALQERMWIWNEEELNMLLNFYGKPFLVVEGEKQDQPVV